uniref:alpha/beta fold hydrolase n=1 Tax=Thaumasiovibrio occultus TaxID=1891184 RepID=UPI000B360FCB|nr:alpha/beta hydrolase [Thaumasiovibrio occultus]
MAVVFSIIILIFAIAYGVLHYFDTEVEDLQPEKVDTLHGSLALLNKGHVYYSLNGDHDAPLVVLIHGFSFPSFAWERNVDALVSAGYCVLTYDVYGRGFSARPDIAYDRTSFVSQLNELLEYLDLQHKPLHIVGLSMGGVIGAAYATDYPEQVCSLTMVAPFYQPIPIGLLKWPVVGDYLARVFYIPKLASMQLDDLGESDRILDVAHRYEVQMRYKGFSRALVRSAQRFLQTEPSHDFVQLRDRQLPSLLLWGDRDTIFPVEQASTVQAFMGETCELKVFEGAGHALPFEYAEQTNQALIQFLAGVPLSSDVSPARA